MQQNDLQLEKSLSEAFRTDCQTLITRFELAYEPNFQSFCEIWRDMQFALIFAYFPTEIALIKFCEKALCISKQFLINGLSMKERIGALYLLYGIYYKIPLNQLKIRLTLSDWNYLMELHSQIKIHEYLDANYILCKLIVDDAFIHCVSDIEYGIEKHSYKNQEKPILDVNLMPEVKDLAEPNGLLSIITKLSKIYEQEKNILYNTKGESSLQLYDPNVAKDIIKNIRKVQLESRIFAKPSNDIAINSNTEPSSMNNDIQKSQKRIRTRKDIILAKIGRAFEKGLHSESEEEQADSDMEDA